MTTKVGSEEWTSLPVVRPCLPSGVSVVGFYEPTPTEGTFDGRSVGIFHVDGNGPVAGDPDSWYRWEGFNHTTDG